MEPSHGYGFAGLVVAKVVCCGALMLAATGAVNIAGLASWLAGGAYLWLAAAALALIGLYLWRRSLSFVVIVHAILNAPLLLLPLIAPYL